MRLNGIFERSLSEKFTPYQIVPLQQNKIFCILKIFILIWRKLELDWNSSSQQCFLKSLKLGHFYLVIKGFPLRKKLGSLTDYEEFEVVHYWHTPREQNLPFFSPQQLEAATL